MRRTWKRDRILLIALGVSFVFHFSMVTLFRIVIYFPRYELGYYRINIVESAGASAFTRAFQPESDGTDYPAQFKGDPGSEEIRHDWLELPTVDLPRLNFSQLEVPLASQLDIHARLRYEELFDSEPDDLWAQVGEKLSMVGELFTRNTKADISTPEATPQRMVVGQPAPGFVASLEWMTPPYTRQALLVEKVEALWGANASVLAGLDGESLVLVFRVNREGEVTFVQMPLADEAGVVQSSADALRHYRFTPLLEGPEEQHGTLTIRAEIEEGLQ